MLKTFRIGGARLDGNKLSAGKIIEPILAPGQIVIPMGQHVGAPSQLVVKKGDKVRAGTLIGKSVGFVSSNIHSPVSGTVIHIDKVPDINGHQCDTAFIDTEGDEWEQGIDRSETLLKECSLSPQRIIEKIARAGVVGMGVAPFPTHVKLIPPAGVKIKTLIVNGAESEPYMTADHALMLEKADEILVGTSILMKATGASRAIIAIENNKKGAIQKLSQAAAAYPDIAIVPLKVKFPQGGEKQLIDAITGLRIPGGLLPISKGIVTQNVSSVFAVYEAVQKNKPLIDRVVTVTGKEVKRPCNVRSRIGTPVSALIDLAGGLPETTGVIVGGGPMTGKALSDLATPLVKGMPGVLLIPSLEARRAKMKNCIRCAKCVDVCPMGLNPAFLMDFVEKERQDKAEKYGITDCIECGLCSYICPSARPLLDYIRSGKIETAIIIRTRRDLPRTHR